jgi:YesN/AraC family two-component response regulator
MMTDTQKILIVDDEPGITSTLSDILTIKGYDVTVADNGLNAVEKVKQTRFAIVITDIVMPGMNGCDATMEIKRISPDTKIIMMTGYGSDHPLVKQAESCDIDRLFHKPFDFNELLKVL